MLSKVSDEKDMMHQFNYFRFSLFLLLLFFVCMVTCTYDNEFDTKENNISTKHRSEPQLTIIIVLFSTY